MFLIRESPVHIVECTRGLMFSYKMSPAFPLGILNILMLYIKSLITRWRSAEGMESPAACAKWEAFLSTSLDLETQTRHVCEGSSTEERPTLSMSGIMPCGTLNKKESQQGTSIRGSLCTS